MTGNVDAGTVDAGPFDAGAADAGPSDAGTTTVSLAWASPSNHQTVSGTVELRLTGTALVNVEVFLAGVSVVRCTVLAQTSATCPLDTTALANGPLTLTAHGWNSAAGQPFTSDAEAGPLVLQVSNTSASTGWSPLTVMAVEQGVARMKKVVHGEAFAQWLEGVLAG